MITPHSSSGLYLSGIKVTPRQDPRVAPPERKRRRQNPGGSGGRGGRGGGSGGGGGGSGSDAGKASP
jgi:hypothetical protein